MTTYMYACCVYLHANAAILTVLSIQTQFPITVDVLFTAVADVASLARTAWRRAEVHDALAATAAVVACACVN